MKGQGEVVADLVFDLGMHRGQDTAYYLAKGYRVVGFEANPELVAECRARFADAIVGGRLTIVAGAVADTDRPQVTFYRPARREMSALGSTDRDWLEARGVQMEAVAVPAVDFAACIEEHGMPWYLKMDIEGSERACLQALLGFEARPVYLSLEAEREDFEALVAELDLLERLGYGQFMAVPQGMASRTVAIETPAGEFEHLFEPSASGPFGEDLTGRWLSRKAVERRHRYQFLRRRLTRWLRRTPRGRRLSWRLYRRFPSLVRYYDTHAKWGGG
jgi:FkbM family methyltransferase